MRLDLAVLQTALTALLCVLSRDRTGAWPYGGKLAAFAVLVLMIARALWYWVDLFRRRGLPA